MSFNIPGPVPVVLVRPGTVLVVIHVSYTWSCACGYKCMLVRREREAQGVEREGTRTRKLYFTRIVV